MSDFELKSNLNTILNRLKDKGKKIIPTVRQGMTTGMTQFHGHIEKTQMSGRPGLKTRTGNLKRSWRVRNEIDRVILGTREKYAAIHQFGGVIKHPGGTPYMIIKGKAVWLKKTGSYKPQVKFTKPHSIKIPKRLRVYEEYRGVGKELILKSVIRGLERLENG